MNKKKACCALQLNLSLADLNVLFLSQQLYSGYIIMCYLFFTRSLAHLICCWCNENVCVYARLICLPCRWCCSIMWSDLQYVNHHLIAHNLSASICQLIGVMNARCVQSWMKGEHGIYLLSSALVREEKKMRDAGQHRLPSADYGPNQNA